jgi:serine phosphatase RsbU (regulator of sigma subunit)/anti-sigma regulatory factor (Ser/Thr protein kinase)
MTSALLYADSVENFVDSVRIYRKEAPQREGQERINYYGKAFRYSQETEDFQLQWECLQDLLTEAQHQGNVDEEIEARTQRIVLLYNNVLNDSVFHYAPIDLQFIREHKDWNKLYEVWGLLVNTYVYDGSTTIGLQEAEKMYEDAKARDHKLGLGLAYYAMGNVFTSMNNMENAAKCYQKGINLLMQLRPKPIQLSELFSSQCEIYEKIGDYERLDRLTMQWREYIDRMVADYKIPKDNPGILPVLGYYYIGCAQANMGLGRLDKASYMLKQARECILSEEYSNFRLWLYYKAKLSYLEGNYAEALQFSQQQMQLFDGTSEPEDMIRAMQQQALIQTKLGNHSEAASLYNKMYLITDSVNGFEMKKQLAEMNTMLHVDEIKMKQADQQKLGIIIIATIIVLSLAIFLFFRIRSAKKLKKAHVELEDAHDKLLTAYDQLEETTTAKERIESELRIARDIQMGMVPQVFPPFPERTDIDLFASMKPAKAVGGDLYDFILLDEKLYFCLGDVSGKGVPASLFMAQATRLFRALAKQQMMPVEIATRMNNELTENNENGMFVTMFLAKADLTNGHVDFCNAGHNPPVIKDGERHAHFLEMNPNAPLGLWPEQDYEGESIDDISGKLFFVYSDGLNEAMNPEEEEFGDDHLLEIIKNLTFENAEATITLIKEEVTKHVRDAEQSDDLTMLCLKIEGNLLSTTHQNEELKPNNMRKEICIKNQISELVRVNQFVEEIGEELELDMELQMNLNLVMEEMVTNVIFYAYPEGKIADIELIAESDGKELTFVLSDQGKAFDPTAKEDTDLDVNPAERDLGGMGIYIVKNIMNKVSYQRLEGKNLLTMKKTI